MAKSAAKAAIRMTALAGSVVFLYGRLINSNKALLKMGIAVADVDKTMARLRKRNDNMVTSLKDAAEAITDFAKKSLAARTILASMPELEKNIELIQEKIAKAIGKDEAKAMMKEFISGVPVSLLTDVFADPSAFGSKELMSKMGAYSAEAELHFQNLVTAVNQVGN